MNALSQFGVARPLPGLKTTLLIGTAVFLVFSIPWVFAWLPLWFIPLAHPAAALIHAATAAMVALLFQHWQLLQQRRREYRDAGREWSEHSWMQQGMVGCRKRLGRRHTTEQFHAAVDHVFAQLNDDIDDTWKCCYWTPICVAPLVALVAGLVQLRSNALLPDFSILFAPLWVGSLELATVGLMAWYMRRQWTRKLLDPWKDHAHTVQSEAQPSGPPGVVPDLQQPETEQMEPKEHAEPTAPDRPECDSPEAGTPCGAKPTSGPVAPPRPGATQVDGPQESASEAGNFVGPEPIDIEEPVL